MIIKRFTVNPLEENCYILHDEETLQAVIIDCGAFHKDEQKEIAEYIETKHLQLVESLLTHGHFDHVWGEQFVYDTYHIRPRMHVEDVDIYLHIKEYLASFMRVPGSATVPPVGDYLNEGDTITFGKQTLTVIHTPGHTPGGLCFYHAQEGILFSGDSLFRRSIGRTDFPGGSYASLNNALKCKILTLPEETMVYPGHGPETNIKHEKTNNAYIR
jgi:glyoxylase-like metal-dependent hydrolase (beta-lactamase superfamily II)